MPPRDVQPFLPSLAAAKRHGIKLPSTKPTEQNRYAALVLDVELQIRETWSEVQRFDAEDSRTIHRSRTDTTREPGPWREGQMASVHRTLRDRVRVDHHFDKRLSYEDVVTPKELATQPNLRALDSALDALFAGRPMPAPLRCVDLTPKARGGGYRASMTQREPVFHGYSFGKGLSEAKKRVDGLLRRGHPMGGRIDVFAVPLLWLRYARADGDFDDMVVFSDGEGQLRGFVGGPIDDGE